MQKVTEALGGSEYVTFFCMILSILELMNKLGCSIEGSDKSNNTINFEMNDLEFDDNVEFVDAQKEKKDLSNEELFLAYLLDPRFKKLRFAISTQQLQVRTALQEKYNSLKSLCQSSLTQTNQPLDFYDE
ncbi:5481_t:CDS:2 [Cetraspora pellucida]|uniref:5481_t:CDS:1 n=1 Tax=Cetraspora pellucida TaxID=1433469 RepID=A0A9N9ILJ1_9GLOM|nr:5481_t:CDS:2 [Cetraspora pellucida]